MSVTDLKAGWSAVCRFGSHTLCASPTCTWPGHRRVTAARPPSKTEFICSVCGDRFASAKWLTSHLAAHVDQASPRMLKDEAPCCVAKADSLGRLPIGYCSRDCLRRPSGGDAA